MALGLALCAAVVLAGCAEPPAQPRPNAGVVAATAAQERLEPEVAEALRRMAATISAAPGFTVRMRTLREGRLPNDQPVLLSGTSAIAARRPDRLAATVGSDLGSFTLTYDGATATLYSPTENVYAASPLTGDVERAVVWLEDRLGIEIPVRPLLAADPYAAMMQAGPTTGSHVGRSFVRETPVEHFALRNPMFDWEIWLEAGPRALPRRVSIVERGGAGAPLRVVLEFEDWNLAPRLPDRAFAFVPPPGAVPATLVLRPE